MSGESATTPLWERPRPLAALFVVVLMVGGVSVGALGWGPLTAVTLGLLLLLLVGACVLMVRSMNRATARETGVPHARVYALSRSVQKERIPHDAAERAAMRLLVAKQRRSTVRLGRYRWAYAAVGAFFLFGSVLKFLDGGFLIGTLFLFGALGQLSQPLAQRRALRRLDRVDAGLDAVQAVQSPRPATEK